MNIIVFGSTGKTGLAIAQEALEKGHDVTAFVRDKHKLNIKHPALSVFVGDVRNQSDVLAALKGQEAVVCALGQGKSLKKTDIRALGTKHIVASMQEIKISRLMVVSAMGVGESWKDLSWLNKLFFATLLKSSRSDHENQEREVKDSNLTWTIVRPSALTDGEKSKDVRVSERLKSRVSKVSRADVASFLIDHLNSEKYANKAVTISL